MTKANPLSQQEDHMLGMEDNNKGIIIITPDKIGALMVQIMDEGNHLIKYITNSTKNIICNKEVH